MLLFHFFQLHPFLFFIKTNAQGNPKRTLFLLTWQTTIKLTLPTEKFLWHHKFILLIIFASFLCLFFVVHIEVVAFMIMNGYQTVMNVLFNWENILSVSLVQLGYWVLVSKTHITLPTVLESLPVATPYLRENMVSFLLTTKRLIYIVRHVYIRWNNMLIDKGYTNDSILFSL